MLRPIWAEHQPLATSPCPPLLLFSKYLSLFPRIFPSFLFFYKALPIQLIHWAAKRNPIIRQAKEAHKQKPPSLCEICLSYPLIALPLPELEGTAGQPKRFPGSLPRIPQIPPPSPPRGSSYLNYRGGVLLVCAKVGTKTAVCLPCHFFTLSNAAGAMRCLCRNFH